jgi:hypothetical protein
LFDFLKVELIILKLKIVTSTIHFALINIFKYKLVFPPQNQRYSLSFAKYNTEYNPKSKLATQGGLGNKPLGINPKERKGKWGVEVV